MVEFKIIKVSETPYLYVSKTSSMAPEDISRKMGEAFQEVWAFMESQGINPAGGALSVYYDYSPDSMTFRAGFTVRREDLAKAQGEIRGDVTPASEVLHFRHKGSYATLRDDYDLMMKHLATLEREMGTPAWEIYLNSPDQVPEAELLTDVYLVLK
ncbi:GyrI-like domain-containing protein [uncultured Devosia sp.]|uniref:GyrI-like domain-containing protein n=1 Tax=uncultured Devosia sp. TaxID=211434 RepID=UPI00261F8EFA|nr:GyrI-like domain-containing protein [uncultured Devosia sp.]